jgi:hypothetical protein
VQELKKENRTMFRRDPRTSEAPQLEELRFTDSSVPSRSCCCPARPAVKVIMPPRAGRPHSVDLWLCGHHYRASAAALLKARARIEDLTVMVTVRPLSDRADLPA